MTARSQAMIALLKIKLVRRTSVFSNSRPQPQFWPDATPTSAANESTPLKKLAAALDDLRKLGRLNLELNHPPD